MKPKVDMAEVKRRADEQPVDVPIGDLLLDQHVVAGLRREHGDGRSPGGDAARYVQRLPRARRLVLGEAERVLSGPALRGLIEDAGTTVETVQQDEPERAADGGVGAHARAEQVAAGMQPDRLAHGSVDDDH